MHRARQRFGGAGAAVPHYQERFDGPQLHNPQFRIAAVQVKRCIAVAALRIIDKAMQPRNIDPLYPAIGAHEQPRAFQRVEMPMHRLARQPA